MPSLNVNWHGTGKLVDNVGRIIANGNVKVRLTYYEFGNTEKSAIDFPNTPTDANGIWNVVQNIPDWDSNTQVTFTAGVNMATWVTQTAGQGSGPQPGNAYNVDCTNTIAVPSSPVIGGKVSA